MSNISIIISGISITVAIAAIVMLTTISSDLESLQENTKQNTVRPGIQQQSAFSLDSKAIDNVITPTKNLENIENKKTNESLLKEINALKNSNKELKQEIRSLENRLEGIHIETKRIWGGANVDSNGERHPVNINCNDRDYVITGMDFQSSDDITYLYRDAHLPDEPEHSLTLDLADYTVGLTLTGVDYHWFCSKIVIPQE